MKAQAFSYMPCLSRFSLTLAHVGALPACCSAVLSVGLEGTQGVRRCNLLWPIPHTQNHVLRVLSTPRRPGNLIFAFLLCVANDTRFYVHMAHQLLLVEVCMPSAKPEHFQPRPMRWFGSVRCVCLLFCAGLQGSVRPAPDALRLGTERERAGRYAAAAGRSLTHQTKKPCMQRSTQEGNSSVSKPKLWVAFLFFIKT